MLGKTRQIYGNISYFECFKKSNGSTVYNMATAVNLLKYVEKQGKHTGIYLILNVPGHPDCQLARVLTAGSNELFSFYPLKSCCTSKY